MAKKKPIKSITVFIPASLNLEKLLKSNPPSFPHHIDNFKYLIDLTYSLFNFDKYESTGDIFTPLSSVLLQRRIRNYREHLDYLIEHKVIREDKQYKVGNKSKGFTISSVFGMVKVKKTKITNQKLLKKINKFYDIDNSNTINNIEIEKYSYITKWFEDGLLKIDITKAEKLLNELAEEERNSTKISDKIIAKWNKNNTSYDKVKLEKEVETQIMLKYNCRLRILTLFNEGTFKPMIDLTAGRLHSTLTQLKSNFRKFVTYNNQNLVAIDIVNSQPYLSSSLVSIESFTNNNILERIVRYNKRFSDPKISNTLKKTIIKSSNLKNIKTYLKFIESGKVYEEFGQLLVDNNFIDDSADIRKEAKNLVFTIFFSKNNAVKFISAIKMFIKEFPNIYKIFYQIKTGQHNTLACILQNLEAELVLDKACYIISQEKPLVPIFTLHDSIITTVEHKEYVHQVLFKVLNERIGIPPVLKYEDWN